MAQIRLAEVLAAFSLACDLGEGQSMGHSLRACYLGMRLAEEMKVSQPVDCAAHPMALCGRVGRG